MTGVGKVVSIPAFINVTAWITKGRIVIEMEDRALEFVGSTSNIGQVISPS